MPDLDCNLEDLSAAPNADILQLSLALRAQIQIKPVRRRYSSVEREQLNKLFAEPERWSESLHSLLWTNLNLNLPGFAGTTLIELPAPCTFDFKVAVTPYIHGLEDWEISTSFLFSCSSTTGIRPGFVYGGRFMNNSMNTRRAHGIHTWEDALERLLEVTVGVKS